MRVLLVFHLLVVVVSDAAAERCEMGDVKGCTVKCEARDADSCSVLGWMHFEGRGIAVDVAKSVELIKKSCEAGSARGCVMFAALQGTGSGVPKDEAAAFAKFEKACADKLQFGCARLGYATVLGQGTKADVPKGLALLERSCAAREFSACVQLGIFHGSGKHVSKDPVKGAGYFKQACEGGHGVACHRLGMLYEAGTGVPHEVPTARRYYTLACDHFVGPACTRLGELFAAGVGGPKNEVKSTELYKLGCERADVTACGKTNVAGATTPMGKRTGMEKGGGPTVDNSPVTAGKQRCPVGYTVVKAAKGLGCKPPGGAKADGESCFYGTECENGYCLHQANGTFVCSLTGDVKNAPTADCTLGQVSVMSSDGPACRDPRITCPEGGSVFGTQHSACPAGTLCSSRGVCLERAGFPVKGSNRGRGQGCYLNSECRSKQCFKSGSFNAYGRPGECK